VVDGLFDRFAHVTGLGQGSLRSSTEVGSSNGAVEPARHRAGQPLLLRTPAAPGCGLAFRRILRGG